MFAEVILNNNAKALNKIFDYVIPKDLQDKVHIGSRVFVPFGRSKNLEDGFVINIKENSDFANKSLVCISEKDNFLDESKIKLAELMSKKYFCNISECIKLMLPPGTSSKDLNNRIREKTGNFVYLLKNPEEIENLIEEKKIKSDKQIRTLRFLFENDGIYSTELEVLTDVSHGILKTLEKNGYIEFVEEVIKRNPFVNKNIVRDEAKILNEEQQVCYNGIEYSIRNNKFSNNLIYGITGSRKNRNIFKINRESFRIK